MKGMKGQKCENCLFAEVVGLNEQGETWYCRRYPPIPFNTNNMGPIQVRLPMNDIEDWCGEWKPQEASSEAKVHADYLEEKGCPQQYTDLLRKFEG